MKTHYLKATPEYFQDVKSGKKLFEVRFNDRDYQAGDTVVLQEWLPHSEQYSGDEITKKITYILDDKVYCSPDYVIMSLGEIVYDGAKIVSDVVEELQMAMTKKPLFTSPHHGYAIILEELDELWDEVKKKRCNRDVKNMRTEAVQVAAMAMKFIMSMDADWKAETKAVKSENPYKGAETELKQIEQKCTHCRYDLVTKEILDELGYDPCETCREDCRNWKPKEEPVDPFVRRRSVKS
jgi:hypothetical protein